MSDPISGSDEASPAELTISTGKANLGALILAVPGIVVIVGLYTWSWGIQGFLAAGRTMLLHPFVPGLFLVAGIVAHEVLHACAWMAADRISWSAIRFGFDAKTLTPFAHCTVAMKAGAYRFGAAVPGVVLGVAPAAAGILAESPGALFFGLLFTLAAGGDFLILWLLRGVPSATMVEDHPTRAGCLVHRNLPAQTFSSSFPPGPEESHSQLH